MKTIYDIRAILAAAAVLVCGGAASADVAMYVPSVTLDAGSKQTIAINLRNNEEVTAFQLDVRLPDGVTVNNIVNEDEETVPDIRLTSRKKSKHQLISVLQDDGTYRIVVISMGNQAFNDTDGAVLNLGVTASSSMQTGSYPVALTNIHVVPLVNGSPGIRMDLPDASQSITVNNQGGETPSASNAFSVIPLTLAPGAEGILNIALANEKEVCSFQFNLKLPSGVSVVKEYNVDDEYVESISLTDRKKSSHELSFKQTDDGGYFLIAYSLSNASFKGNEGSIVAIKVKADESMPYGDYGVVMSNILLVNPDEEKISLPVFSGILKISEDGVVEDVVCGKANVYSEAGMCIVEDTFAGNLVEVYGLDGTKVGEYVSTGDRIAIPVGSVKVAVVRISDGNRYETYKLTIKH